MAVVALDPGPLDRAARGLLPLLFAALVPPLLLASARLGPRFRTVAAAGLTALQLGLLASAASPALFDEEATRASPGAATWFSLVRSVADPDRDGHMVLFDGRDCDEGDPGVNAVAYDIPGDGVDRDCDGADGVADTPAARGVYLGGEPPNPHGRPRKYNVLFVLMDSLRADHLELGGYFRQTAPNLEMLAVESLVFTNARAQYPSTGISLPSLLSGRYPEYMEWSVPGHPRRYSVGKRNMLLPQILRPAGYRTSAVLVPWVVGNVLGLASRFDDVYPSYAPGQWRKYNTNGSPAVVTRALEALAQRREGKPFFLFVHMEEPHRPYANHPAPGRVFGQSPEDRYDSDIYWADLWLGFLLGVMRESGLMDDTVVIVAADHGEAFGEHGTRQHGRQLYEESIRLPIFLRIPGQEEGRVITTPVALVDIVPTVLDLTGVEFPRSGLQGVSLLRTADGEAPDRPVFSMVADREVRPTRHVKAVTQGGYKYLRDMGSGGEELYDLAADPGEEVNLVDQRRDVVGRMRATLDAYLEDADPSWKVY
jgi:arylsulfatase A-like enzyme